MGRFQDMSLRAAMTLMVVGFLLFAAAGWFLLIGPQRSEAAQLQHEIEATRVLLAAPIPEPEERVDPEVAGDRLTRAMPDRVAMPAVILDLNRVAGEAGVRLDSIAPGAPVAMTTYQTMPITLTLQGSYFGFTDFLRRLRSQARVVDGEVQGDGRIYSVDSISFGEGQPQFPILTANLTISTVFGPVAPPAEGAAPAEEGSGAMPDAP